MCWKGGGWDSLDLLLLPFDLSSEKLTSSLSCFGEGQAIQLIGLLGDYSGMSDSGHCVGKCSHHSCKSMLVVASHSPYNCALVHVCAWLWFPFTYTGCLAMCQLEPPSFTLRSSVLSYLFSPLLSSHPLPSLSSLSSVYCRCFIHL